MLYLLRRTPVKTLKHLPKFLPIDDDFKNTELISDDEHEKLRLAVLDVKNQLFVETATWGLSDWERVLDLSVKENASIEDRRIQILLKLQGLNTVSETFMNNLINMFCEDKSGYIIQHNPEYWFELCISGDDEIKWKELLEAVNTYKPAHLGFAVVIRIISQILTSHKANITQYVNANHNFWNLGTAEKTYWDGVWCWDGSIDWSGLKPNAKYKERQSHVIDILAKVNSTQTFKTGQSADITYKITSKHRLLTSHKANITQYVNANHNFWNLGTAEKTYWDGVWCWDGSIDWSGLKPNAKYKERQSHVIDILAKVNSTQTFKTGQSADITYKITSKHRLLTSHKAGSIYYVDIDLKQNIENKALNTGKINATQSRTTGNAKNLWDGSFCWDGSHAWEGDYTLQNAQMENLCTCYSTDKNGNIRKGTFERL